jgi:hypothetical protein
MDRETLETLCQTFAARQSISPLNSSSTGADPVLEILRSFRLAEISAAEMESLLGLVTDDEASAVSAPDAGLLLARFDGGLDEPPVLVDDFPDFDEIIAAGIVADDDDDDDDESPLHGEVVEIRVSSARPGADVSRSSGSGG